MFQSFIKEKCSGLYYPKLFFRYYTAIEMISYIFILQSNLSGSFLDSSYISVEKAREKIKFCNLLGL